MTDELTLREKVILSVAHLPEESQPGSGSNIIYAAIIDALEDTGSPAHMRIAAELRGLDGGLGLKEGRPCSWFYLMALFVTAGVLIGYCVT